MDTHQPNFSLSAMAALAPERTMGIVLEALHELVDYELAVVLGYDGEDTLRVHTATGPLRVPALRDYSISLSRRPDIAGILAGGEPYLFREDEAHEDAWEEVLDLPDNHSCMVAPLVVDGKTIGLLTLDHRSCGVFSPQILSFIRVISRLIAIALLQSERTRNLSEVNRALLGERNRLLSTESDAFRSLVGTSTPWMAVLDSIKLVAASSAPVLINGETGTGKEEVARAIHRLSDRSTGPFVALNCSALSPSLAESELFGHEKGSFTGAQTLRRGRFELADGGTLFLDELGELPLEIQPKLLRALQEGIFERVGGERSVNVNIRFIAATNVNLIEAVKSGRFREDLWYRLSVFPLELPPLRERGDDVLLLAEHFLSRLRERAAWTALSFDGSALEILLERMWPGNVRELRNAIERAAILARGGVITALELGGSEKAGTNCNETDSKFVSEVANLGGTGSNENKRDQILELDEVQRRHIRIALEKSDGKIYGSDGAAVLLGLKPSTLQSRMKKLGLTKVSNQKPAGGEN